MYDIYDCVYRLSCLPAIISICFPCLHEVLAQPLLCRHLTSQPGQFALELQGGIDVSRGVGHIEASIDVVLGSRAEI